MVDRGPAIVDYGYDVGPVGRAAPALHVPGAIVVLLRGWRLALNASNDGTLCPPGGQVSPGEPCVVLAQLKGRVMVHAARGALGWAASHEFWTFESAAHMQRLIDGWKGKPPVFVHSSARAGLSKFPPIHG